MSNKPHIQKELMNSIYEAWSQRKNLLGKINTVETEISTNPQARSKDTVHRVPNTNSPSSNSTVSHNISSLSASNLLVSCASAVASSSSSTSSTGLSYTTSCSLASVNNSSRPVPSITPSSNYIRGDKQAMCAATSNMGEQYGTSGIKLLCDLLNGTLPEVPCTSTSSRAATSPAVTHSSVHSPKPYRTSSPFSISSLVSSSGAEDSRRGASPGNRGSPLVGNSNTLYSPLLGTSELNSTNRQSPSQPRYTGSPNGVRHIKSESPVNQATTGTPIMKSKSSSPSNFSIAHLTKDLKNPKQDLISGLGNSYSTFTGIPLPDRLNPPPHMTSLPDKQLSQPPMGKNKDDRAEILNSPRITAPGGGEGATTVVVADSPSTPTPTPKRRPGRPRKYPLKPKISVEPVEVTSTLSPSKSISSSDGKSEFSDSTKSSTPVHEIISSSIDSSDIEVSNLLAKEPEPQSPSISSTGHKSAESVVSEGTPGLVDSNPSSAYSPIHMPQPTSLNESMSVALPSFDMTFSPTKTKVPMKMPADDNTEKR